MLKLEWADLEVVTADIARIQSQRQAAKMVGNAERADILGNELARAVTQRDNLILRIAEQIGGGAQRDAPGPEPHATPLP